MSTPVCSVILPTYLRPVESRHCVENLLDQDRDDFEILVVDQTPDPPADHLAWMASHAPRVRYFRKPDPNLPAARNFGIVRARGPVIVFVDDDVRIPPGFVSAHLANYRDPRIDAVAGAVLDDSRAYTGTLPAGLDDPYLRLFCASWQYERRMPVMHAPGGNHSFRRSVVDAAGLFDERYTGPGFREESDFFMRVSAAGSSIVYDPACWLVHLPGRTPGGCWAGFDGAVPEERYFNHAFFILKNFPPSQRLRLFFRTARTALLNRAALRNPRAATAQTVRFLRGWLHAWGTAPREGWASRAGRASGSAAEGAP